MLIATGDAIGAASAAICVKDRHPHGTKPLQAGSVGFADRA